MTISRRWLSEGRTKLASFNFSVLILSTGNRLLILIVFLDGRVSGNIFNTRGTRLIAARGTCNLPRCVRRAAARKCVHTSAFCIDKNEEERERVSPRGGLGRTAGCLLSAAGCAHHGSGRVYQHRVFNVTTFQLGLVSPSAASDGCSLSGSDSFRSLIPLAPLFARRDRRCERAGRGGCTCNMCVTSYISRVRHT